MKEILAENKGKNNWKKAKVLIEYLQALKIRTV